MIELQGHNTITYKYTLRTIYPSCTCTCDMKTLNCLIAKTHHGLLPFWKIRTDSHTVLPVWKI